MKANILVKSIIFVFVFTFNYIVRYKTTSEIVDSSLRRKVSETLLKGDFSTDNATFLSKVLDNIDQRQDHQFREKFDQLLTWKDQVEILDRLSAQTRTIYSVELVQFLAIVSIVLAIVIFLDH